MSTFFLRYTKRIDRAVVSSKKLRKKKVEKNDVTDFLDIPRITPPGDKRSGRRGLGVRRWRTAGQSEIVVVDSRWNWKNIDRTTARSIWGLWRWTWWTDWGMPRVNSPPSRTGSLAGYPYCWTVIAVQHHYPVVRDIPLENHFLRCLNFQSHRQENEFPLMNN